MDLVTLFGMLLWLAIMVFCLMFQMTSVRFKLDRNFMSENVDLEEGKKTSLLWKLFHVWGFFVLTVGAISAGFGSYDVCKESGGCVTVMGTIGFLFFCLSVVLGIVAVAVRMFGRVLNRKIKHGDSSGGSYGDSYVDSSDVSEDGGGE